jgi:16S rRNA (adenine1518-N6/adenine1519-N6)-dimethyltransferase
MKYLNKSAGNNEKIFAKKSLGQNFLQSTSALEKIISAGEINSGETVLEIGPGKGALTKYLLDAGANVIAVEKDTDMIKILQEKFSEQINNGQLQIIEADILDTETKLPSKYKLIANIPYYITGEIIRKFLSDMPAENQPDKMVLLVQKEVADRIMTRDNKESLLSISVKAYCQPKYIAKVPAGSFVPAPKVDSAIIAFENINKNRFSHEINEEIFFEILRAGFAHKRKRLFSNIKKYLGKDLYKDKENELQKAMISFGLDENVRAEELRVEQWIQIAKILL